jgi:hypothetical protein
VMREIYYSALFYLLMSATSFSVRFLTFLNKPEGLFRRK